MLPWYMLALWGALGAFIYAAPKFSACFFTARQTGGSSLVCSVEATISMLTGIFASVVVSPWLYTFLGRTGEHEIRAISALVGLLANPVAPKLFNVETLISMLRSVKGPT